MRREVVDRLTQRRDELQERFLRSLRAEVAAYGEDDASVVPAHELYAASRRHVEIALGGILDAGELTAKARGQLGQLARERAGQGVPLHALLQAFQIGARELWQAVLEVAPPVAGEGATLAELLAELSRASLQLTSEISATVTAGYVETGRHRLADRERIRHELLEQVLSGAPAASGPLRRRAESVGYRFGGAHIVAVVSPNDAGAATDHAHTRIRDALRRTPAPGAEPLLGTHGDMKVAVYPVPTGISEQHLRHTLDRNLDDAGIAELGYHAAIGRVEPGIAGIATSYRQAATTLQLARDCGLTGQTLSYVRSLPWLLLSASPEAARDLQQAVLEPLRRHDRERGTVLVQTCSVLLDVQGNRAEAAKALHVHRHTLATRLRRIEELTGRSFDDRDDVLLLELGMRADDLLGRAEDRDEAS
jgi:hypothetical protein